MRNQPVLLSWAGVCLRSRPVGCSSRCPATLHSHVMAEWEVGRGFQVWQKLPPCGVVRHAQGALPCEIAPQREKLGLAPWAAHPEAWWGQSVSPLRSPSLGVNVAVLEPARPYVGALAPSRSSAWVMTILLSSQQPCEVGKAGEMCDWPRVTQRAAWLKPTPSPHLSPPSCPSLGQGLLTRGAACQSGFLVVGGGHPFVFQRSSSVYN